MTDAGAPPSIQQLFDLGLAAWPQLALEPGVFHAHVTTTSEGGLPSVDYAADVFLACACAHDVRGAVAAFEEAYTADLSRAIARIDSEPAFVADALQNLRERLLLRHGTDRAELPRIGDFAGRSSLRTWLTSAASRTALNMRRNKSAQSHDEVRSDAMVEEVAPELAVLRARYRPHLEAAIRDALAGLDKRQRTLLRLNLHEHMSIDALATMYGVGRSTAARWLAAARDTLSEKTRGAFCARAKISPDEYESIAGAIRSELDVSLTSQLASLAS